MSYLFKDIQSPLKVDENNKMIINSEVFRLRQAIKLLLSTKPISKISKPDMDSTPKNYVFRSLTSEVLVQIRRNVEEALFKNESRIKVLSVNTVTFPEKPGFLHLEIEYKILESHIIDNIVHPIWVS